MIPISPGFFRPHGGGGGVPPGEDYTCVSPNLLCDFDTDGAIDGESPEVAPDANTFYESASAVAADGLVSPANFNVIMDGDTVETYETVLQAYVVAGETVKIAFKTTSVTDDSGTIISV